MKTLVDKILELNKKLLRCDEDEHDSLIDKIESLLEKATLYDLKEIYDEESYIAKYEWPHQELADYYYNMVHEAKLDKNLSIEDL